MSKIRPVIRQLRGTPASDGAGVKLVRIIGSAALPDLDPFLMLDEFGTDQPADYLAGFPSHPHRGFETVTYMLEGRMRHKDNHGNEGLLVPGGVQWMTAGRGIVHSEMPEQEEGRMRGFQLWVNLPADSKMVPPRYQEYGPERFQAVDVSPGVRVKVIAGEAGGQVGAIVQPATQPLYLDIQLADGAAFEQPVPEGHAAFAYVYEGAVQFGASDSEGQTRQGELAVFGPGTHIAMKATAADTRLILAAGRPLNEPIARYGPFVMNTQAELRQAFQDFQAGRF